EWPAVRREHGRSCLQAAVSEEDVGGYHDGTLISGLPQSGLLGDPVVGGVEPAGDHHPLHPRSDGYAERAVADHADGGLVALSDAVDFFLYRTSVGVDEDAQGHWLVATTVQLPLPHEFRAKDEALDAVILAVDFLAVAGQPDRLDQRAPLQRLARAFHLQVLDQRDLVPIGEQVADRVAHFHTARCRLPDRQFGSGHPLAAILVVYVIVVAHHRLSVPAQAMAIRRSHPDML